jgi:lipase (class 3)
MKSKRNGKMNKKILLIILISMFSANTAFADGAIEIPSLDQLKAEKLKLEKDLYSSKKAGDATYAVTDANKKSFFASLTKEAVDGYAQLAKEIYMTDHSAPDEVNELYEAEAAKTEVENNAYFIKLNKYTEINEIIKSGAVSSAEFQRIVTTNFRDFIDEINLDNRVTQTEQLRALETISMRIAARIDANNAAIEKFNDPFYLIVQKYPVVKHGYFKDSVVIKIFKRYGEQFSGAVLYDPIKNQITVAIPGTFSGADWMKNIQVGSDDGNFVPGHKLWLHVGFVKIYNEIREQLQNELARWASIYKIRDPSLNLHPLSVVVTGHSLGGAVSTLAALDIKMNILPKYLGAADGQLPWKVANINFASPRVAGKKTAEEIDNLMGKYNIVRFVNYYDPVPNAVMEIINAKHVGIEIGFNSGFWGGVISTTPIVAYHSMSKYVAAAGKAFKKVSKKGKKYAEKLKKHMQY